MHRYSLRPWAYRVDLWRLMILWEVGGIYLDAKMKLFDNISKWVDIDKDEFATCLDGRPNAYWQAVLALRPRLPVVLNVIRDIVVNISKHYYGDTPIAITGPDALYIGA